MLDGFAKGGSLARGLFVPYTGSLEAAISINYVRDLFMVQMAVHGQSHTGTISRTYETVKDRSKGAAEVDGSA